jgi:hypothetical protein
MESGAKALRPTYLKLEQQHVDLEHRSRDNLGAICIEQQLVDPLEPTKNRGGLCGEALCMFDSGKNLSQHCTLRYDAGCPGDAPLRLNAVKCVLS